MRRLLVSLLLLATVGCAARPQSTPAPAGAPPAAPVAPPAAPVATPVADLVATGNPERLPPEELAGWLTRVANAGHEPLLPWLQAVVAHWYPGKHGGLTLADLDGDGTLEIVMTLNGVPGASTSPGGIFVLHRSAGAWAVDAALNPEDDNSTIVLLNDVVDLTGQGQPQIVWSTEGHGATTGYGTVYVSRWTPGHLEMLHGAKMYITFPSLKMDGHDLLLSGGGSGSTGAGLAQRSWTDRYRWVDGAFAHVDRVFTPSSFSYHQLQDGIVAEQYGRTADARAAFAAAMEPSRTPLDDKMLFPSDPGKPAALAAAVQAFARFRLGALLLRDAATAAEGRAVLAAADGPYAGLAQALRDAKGHAQGCQAAGAWAAEHPEFLAGLNSPFGYANPTWRPADLCGWLPPHRD